MINAQRRGGGLLSGLRAGRRGGALKGCLIALVIFLVLVVIGVIVVVMNWRNWFASAAGAGIEAMIDASHMPATEKQESKAHFKQLMDDFRAGNVSMGQLSRVAEELEESPVFPVALTMWFEQSYVLPSAMPDEEKAEARLTMDRFARGLYEEKIPFNASDDVLAPMMETTPDGDEELKQNPTVDDIRAALANMKQRADDAGVPEESFTIDVSDEVKKAIDRALGAPETAPSESAQPESTDPAPAPDEPG